MNLRKATPEEIQHDFTNYRINNELKNNLMKLMKDHRLISDTNVPYLITNSKKYIIDNYIILNDRLANLFQTYVVPNQFANNEKPIYFSFLEEINNNLKTREVSSIDIEQNIILSFYNFLLKSAQELLNEEDTYSSIYKIILKSIINQAQNLRTLKYESNENHTKELIRIIQEG